MAPTGKPMMSIDPTPTLGLAGQRKPLCVRPEPLHPLLERRAEPRVHPRLACRLRTQRGVFAGVASQMGPGGLHVETDADLRPGETVFVVLESTSPGVPERGCILYRRQAPQSLASVAPSGVGIRLESPSPLYRSLLESLAGSARSSQRR